MNELTSRERQLLEQADRWRIPPALIWLPAALGIPAGILWMTISLVAPSFPVLQGVIAGLSMLAFFTVFTALLWAHQSKMDLIAKLRDQLAEKERPA
jgi:hypothetical protein